MNTQIKPVSEISRRATHILFKEMGVVDTVRFLNGLSGLSPCTGIGMEGT